MTYPSDSQKHDIQVLLDKVKDQSSPEFNKYFLVYELILEQITISNGQSTEPIDGIDVNVWLWLRGASEVNKGEGTFSNWIREYTAAQVANRNGESAVPSTEQMQAISNAIAENVIDAFLENATNPLTLWDLGNHDAGTVIGSLFEDETDFSSWSGVPLFLLFGNNEFFTGHILDDKNGTYDAISMLSAISQATGGALATDAFSALATGLQTWAWNSSGFWGTTALLDSTNSQMRDYLSDYYNYDFGQFGAFARTPIAAKLHEGDEVFGTDGNDLIHAGVSGDDVVNGSGGSDLIDGGGNEDTLAYSEVSVTVNINGNYTYADGKYVIVQKAGPGGGTDQIYGIEELLLGNLNDTVKFWGGIYSAISVDMGLGTNTIDFTDYAQSVSLDLRSDGRVEIANATVENADRFILSSYDDDFGFSSTTWAKPIYVDGGIGNDRIESGPLADMLIGGSNGSQGDTLSYQASTGAVMVDLATSTASGGHAQGDVISSFENVIGSNSTDYLAGNGGSNSIWGGDGNDTITGGGGADKLYGGAGDDLIIAYGGTSDTSTELHGGAGADSMVSHGANNVFYTNMDGDSVRGGGANNKLSLELMMNGVTFIPHLYHEYTGDGSNSLDFNGISTIQLTNYDDVLQINTPNVHYYPLEAIVFRSGPGNDAIYAYGYSTTFGEEGNDTFTLGSGARAYGDEGNDEFFIESGASAVAHGGDGNDSFWLGLGGNKISLGSGTDYVSFYEIGGYQEIYNFQAGLSSGDIIELPDELLFQSDGTAISSLEFFDTEVSYYDANDDSEIDAVISFSDIYDSDGHHLPTGGSLILSGVGIGQLSLGDIMFV